MNDYFVIGKIVNTQGIKGEIKVIPTTDDPLRFEELKEIIIDVKGNLKNLKVKNVRYNKQFVILKLDSIDTMNDAEKLKGYEIKIDSKDALPLEKDEYYIRDLYGIDVITNEGEKLGKIEDIIFTGANDVYVVKEDNKKDLLIPAIKQCILQVDIENKIMTVKLLEGLR